MRWQCAILLTACMGLAACGEDAPQAGEPAATGVPAAATAIPLRIADSKRSDGPARCDGDEELVNAFCFPDPDRSISASGPVFLRDPDGSFSVDCLTGGANIRLFCLKR